MKFWHLSHQSMASRKNTGISSRKYSMKTPEEIITAVVIELLK